MKYITPLFFLLSFFGCSAVIFAGGKCDGIKDTLNTKQTHLITEKKLFPVTNERIIRIIDSLFADESDNQVATETVVRVNELLKQVDSAYKDSNLYPANCYYTTWDIDNFFPLTDLLTADTTLELKLTDSLHSNYFHPCPGVINSNFGWRKKEFHKGTDINLRRGENVYAAFDGKIRIAKRNSGYGNVIIIRHYNGLETVYAHLSKIKVKTGQEIKAGSVIGLGGSTGKSTGPHLHFEVRFKGQALDPSGLISFNEQKLLYDTLVVKRTRNNICAFPKNAKFHSVEKGETIYTIAQRYGLSTAIVRRLNNLYGKAWLRVGQKIRIS